MASHADCNNWDYETHPKIKQLRARCDWLTALAAKRPARFAKYGFDTRPGHRLMFAPFAPTACRCFAGTFRGDSSCSHLVNYSVHVHGTNVGAPPNHVAAQMAVFDTRCKLLFDLYTKSSQTLDPAEALVKLIDILCDLLESFFTIHPYANGNGHTGRLLVWVLLARHGFIPRKWSIDAKQPYGRALNAYRAGKPRELQLWLLRLAR
jgi:fido (protein-threonine AMPylation protein)